MSELNIKKQDNPYNDEPVFYCKSCLSLKIKTIPMMSGFDYCDKCGSTNIGETSIQEWEKLYIEKYGHSQLENY